MSDKQILRTQVHIAEDDYPELFGYLEPFSTRRKASEIRRLCLDALSIREHQELDSLKKELRTRIEVCSQLEQEKEKLEDEIQELHEYIHNNRGML